MREIVAPVLFLRKKRDESREVFVPHNTVIFSLRHIICISAKVVKQIV